MPLRSAVAPVAAASPASQATTLTAARLPPVLVPQIIDVNYYPVETARRSNMRHRPIGLGVQVGLGRGWQARRAHRGWQQSRCGAGWHAPSCPPPPLACACHPPSEEPLRLS